MFFVCLFVFSEAENHLSVKLPSQKGHYYMAVFLVVVVVVFFFCVCFLFVCLFFQKLRIT